jgi:hypothetical protein
MYSSNLKRQIHQLVLPLLHLDVQNPFKDWLDRDLPVHCLQSGLLSLQGRGGREVMGRRVWGVVLVIWMVSSYLPYTLRPLKLGHDMLIGLIRCISNAKCIGRSTS